MAYKLRAKMRPQPARVIPAAVAFPSELDKEVLDRITEFGMAAGLGKGLVAEGDVDVVHRDALVAWLMENSTTRWLYQIVDTLMARANEVWKLDIRAFPEPLQYSVYEKGHFYGWHWDQTIDSETHRKMALTLQLSDGEAYAGGDLEIMEQDGIGRPLPGARKRGHVIAFPGWVLHQVTPVTAGERHSLVAWAHGPRVK